MKAKRFTKGICTLAATIIFMGTLSLGAWADNNPLQMMADRETWVDEEGITWMPAPISEAEIQWNPYTGEKSYSWTIPKDTTYYTDFLWPLDVGDKMTISAVLAANDVCWTGIIGMNTWCQYSSRHTGACVVTHTIQNEDLFKFYAANSDDTMEGAISVTLTVTPTYNSLS